MRTKQFWVDAAERAVRTFAQALLAVLGAGFVITDGAAWGEALLAAGFAALLSVLTSVAAGRIGDPDSAAMLPVDKAAEGDY